MNYQFELVGKIGSMALIRKEDRDIDYNIFSRLGADPVRLGQMRKEPRRLRFRVAGPRGRRAPFHRHPPVDVRLFRQSCLLR